MKPWLAMLLAISVWVPSVAKAADVGDPAPDFSLKTLDGAQFSLADFRGRKPVYLIFWATWCPNCRHEIPEIKKIYRSFHDRMAILAINVSINDSVEKARRYVKKYDLPYAVAFDEGAKVTRAYGVMGTPTQFVIDRNGVIRYRDAATPRDLAEHFAALAGE